MFIFKKYFRKKTRFKRGLVEAQLVENEDEIIVTLSKRDEAVKRLLNSYEQGAERGEGDPDIYADTLLHGDYDEIESIMAKDWAEAYLEYKNIKKGIKIVWAEE